MSARLKDGQLVCYVKVRRLQLGMTQGSLAEDLGTTQAVISRIESGRVTTIVIALKIAAALDCDVENLWSVEP